MAVEEGHVLNIDGAANNNSNNNNAATSSDNQATSSSSKYKLEVDATEPLFTVDDDEGGGGGAIEKKRRDSDRVSVLSGYSQRSSRTANSKGRDSELPWYKGLEWKDFKGILPCFLILLIGAIVMIRITPMAYQQVYEQIKEEEEANEMRRLAEERAAQEAEMAKNESVIDQVLRASMEAGEG